MRSLFARRLKSLDDLDSGLCNLLLELKIFFKLIHVYPPFMVGLTGEYR